MRSWLALALSATVALAAQTALAQSPVGGGSGETAGAPPAGTPTPAPAAAAPLPTTSPDEYSITDVAEKDHKTYYFVGLRYRGTGIPQFMVNLFIGEGATFYSHTVGIEV